MRICLKCGQVVGERDKRCRECGAKLGASDQSENREGKIRIEKRDCVFCEGKGSIPRAASILDKAMHREDKCEVCNGTKKIIFELTENEKLVDCDRCNVTGRQWKVRGLTFQPCERCKGKGRLIVE